MTKRDIIHRMAERSHELADKSMKDLRNFLCGFHCDEQPSFHESDQRYGKWTKGALIDAILLEEFSLDDPSLDEES